LSHVKREREKKNAHGNFFLVQQLLDVADADLPEAPEPL